MLTLCVGMYRACSTWQYGVVGLILEKYRGGRRLGFVEGTLFHEKVDAKPPMTGWSVLKAHDAHPRFAELLASNRAVGFYAFRDLRDVVFSYVHKTGVDFDTTIGRGFVELCLGNDVFWRSQPGMLVQRYDDLIADPARGVEEIADHLGVALEPGEAETIAANLSRESNQRKIDAMAHRLRDEGTELADDDQSRFDPVSLLHWNHIRPTAPDGGLKSATPRQRALIESLGRSWLEANGFELAEQPIDPVDPVIRTSYAPSRVDVRLDRLFRGVKGTLVGFDATLPRVRNASFFFYERGWRGVNVGTTSVSRDRFVIERPNDLNLACRFSRPEDGSVGLGASGFAAGVLTDLAAEHHLAPPDLILFNRASDVDQILGAVAASTWRPQVFVVDQANPESSTPEWPRMLERLGYQVVPGLDGVQVYLRDDLAHEIPTLARPLGDDDHFRPADWSVAELQAHAELEHQAKRADRAARSQVEPIPLADSSTAITNDRARRQLELDSQLLEASRAAWEAERNEWADRIDDGSALRTAFQEREFWRNRAKIERDRLRLAHVKKRVLRELVATLKEELNDQVELRVRQLIDADRAKLEVERSLADAELKISEAFEAQNGSKTVDRGIKATLRRIWWSSGPARPGGPHQTRAGVRQK